MRFDSPNRKRRFDWSRTRSLLAVAGVAACLAALGADQSIDEKRYPGASAQPLSRAGWEPFQTEADPKAPKDEAQSGETMRHTPVPLRSDNSFPAESRNAFSTMDQVPDGSGSFKPFDFTDGKTVTEEGRDAIRGRNTWILWGGGNEGFWGWLDENNYGLVDFLILLDSRKRGRRFSEAGLINQPGMKAQNDPSHKLHELIGLYLDEGDGQAVVLPGLREEKTGSKQKGNASTDTSAYPPAYEDKNCNPAQHSSLYCDVVDLLPKDGVNPEIYGYPSGVIGLRLWPNPDFFADTRQAARARAYWEKRVTKNADRYYIDYRVNADPNLVRPFRVSMTCGFCHVAPHPLNPPANAESPEWENLSSTIGNQYWHAVSIFSNLAHKDNFLYWLLASEQPGTVDASLISTDNINNANTINAVFDVPARLERADENPTEAQSGANLLTQSMEEKGGNIKDRHVPRVLLDGADSIGAFGSLSRVYLNIGTFPEEWLRLHNPLLGFVPQQPFSVATLRANSAYWRATENYRIPYLWSFFTYQNVPRTPSQGMTAPMKLADARKGEGRKFIDQAAALRGRTVFLRNCAICHSSKQPDEFKLTFSREWAKSQSSASSELTLPTDFRDWELFKQGGAYARYVAAILNKAGAPTPSHDKFFEDNFLSTDIRVPVTLVGTNSARAMGTNAMKGQMWDNFSSEAYKNLDRVGPVRFYNPYLKDAVPDEWGNNDEYWPPKGGVGYYRPASLIGLWATAPYLHNNSLGIFNQDPSIEGRVAAFNDGVDRLLSQRERARPPQHLSGDLRGDAGGLAEHDPGYIYRTPDATWVFVPGKFIRPVLEGVVNPSILSFAFWGGIGLAVLLGFLSWWYPRPRHAGFALIVIAVVLGLALIVTRVDRVYWMLWLPVVALVFAALWFWTANVARIWASVVLGLVGILIFVGTIAMHMFLDGKLGDLRVGPIPKGTPVNLIANINPAAPTSVLVDALSGAARGILRVRKDGLQGKAALDTFDEEAGMALLRASKCPDFVLDRGHWFGDALTGDEKKDLKAFLKTL